MLKGIFGSNENGSEVSSSSKRKSKRREGEEEEGSQISRRSRADSTGTSSTSKRKSSRRESTDQSSGFHPTSTAFSSTSRAPYADVAGPSVASSYATAYDEQTNAPMQRPEVVRNESMAEKASRSERPAESRRDSKRDSRDDTRRSIDDDDERRNASRSDTSRRDSRRKPSRKDTATRAAEDHDNSLPQNQFPGQEPAGFGVASPYRPPGLASDYYGDHGESIAEQPGVRPDRPSILISADQAHLWEPTVEAKPPPEPSSLGQVGAAASFFGGESFSEPLTNTTPSRPGKGSSSTPGRKQSLQPGKDSTGGGASPRSSPGPNPGRRPLPPSQNSGGIGMMGAGAAPLAAGAMAAGAGAAAEYFSGNIDVTPHDQPLSSGIPGRPDDIDPGSGRPPPSTMSGSQSYHTTTENMQTASSTITSSSRPPRTSQPSSSNLPLYGAAAAAAGVAGAAYLAHEHTSAQHEQAFSQSPTDYQGRPSDLPFRPGQNQPQASFGPPQQQIRRRRTGAFGKFVDWLQDPAAVAEYEAYTEAIGVCKYCFEPGTTPAEAPRKHYYRRRRPSSGSRYGSSTRVDKLTRYSSDENLRRRNSKKGYSTTEKVLATGLAGVGVAAVANEVYKNKNDFDDTYSVKSGRPDNRSRVSFQENQEERYSTSKRKSRREPEGLSRRDFDRRRQSESEEARYEKRSSRRRDSSDSDNRITSRGGNLSTPIALAGAAAVGAALTSSGSRRRSRSRSKSPRKNRKGYYSKRVSPKHSYVDLNQTLEDTPSGTLGLGGFFSSPSSNSKRGKKKKGLFNFSNNSSSSSDADLVFGEGTVKRKERRGRKDDRRDDKRQSGMGDTAAILGLAATGAALAAETSRRDDKVKRKEDKRTGSNRYYDDRNRKSRRDSTNKIKVQSYEDSADNGGEGVWEDASDDDQSSVDMALAYGGRLSSRASKESLNEGTNILGWRFGDNQKKREEEKRLRRQSSKPDLSGYDPVKAGLVAGATGLAGAAAANYYSRPGPVAVESPPKDMPTLQYVDPVPIDSREQTPRKQSMQSSVSPLSFPTSVTKTSDASLEHPQPVTPISSDVYHARQSYTDGPSGPVVFDKPGRNSRGQETGIIPVAAVGAVAIGAAGIAIDSERDRKRDNPRSATMPAVVPSLRDSVSFDLTAEQEEREKKRERKRREKEARKAEKAASAARDAIPKASIITGAERSPERKLETWRLRDAVKAGGLGSMEPPVRDPSPQLSSKDLSDVPTQPLPTPERETRLSEIDRQLEELYAQHREQEARKKRKMEAAGLATAAVAVGAGVVAATSSSPDKDEKKPRRKSSLRKSSKYRDQDVETESAVSARSAPSASASDTGTETASERLARKAARRVRNQRTPSPVYQHDDYTTFFVPPELKEYMAEHNRDAELEEAKIVDIVPGMKRAETFPDELYHVYGTEDTDMPPTKLAWRVPMLGLVSPTPPPQSPMITAEDSPVILATSGRKDIGEPEIEDVDTRDIEPKRSNSKVTWGDHEINVYEVVTPEYERDSHDFTTASPETSAKKDVQSSPLRQAFTADDVEEKKPFSSNSTPAMQFEQFNPSGSTTSDGSFYQSPFASTVSDLDLPVSRSSSRVPTDGTGFVEGEIPEEKSDERISKSERRRHERAEAAAEAEKVMPETRATQTRDVAEPQVPGGFDDAASNVNVYDYMVTTNGSNLPSASVLGAAATSVRASDVGMSKGESTDAASTRDLPAETDIARPKRSDTFDEGDLIDSFATPKRAETFAEGDFKTPKSRTVTSDPEDWEKTSSSSKKSKSKSKSRDSDDLYTSRSSSSKKKSKRDSQVFNDDNDDDVKSVASSPADASRPVSKRKSLKRDDDDDTRSVMSDTKSAASEPTSSSKQKSKDLSSGTPKKSGWALIGGLIGAATASKSDVSTKSDSSEKRKSKSSDSGKKRRSSNNRDREDSAASESRRSRSASQSSAPLPAREESVDDAFVSADEHGRNGHADTDEREVGVEQQKSFLATRPELPKPTGSEIEKEQGSGTGVSGLPLQSESQAPFPQSLTGGLDSQARSNAVAPLETSDSVPEHEQGHADFETPTQPRQRRLSNLRTADLGSSPTIGSPARVGRFPVSPGIIRTGSAGSPPAVLATSPLTTPRSRQGRPTSSDFRSGKEFRPLYLVERHSATKVPVQEEEETYPSLPSSRTSSAHPSLENLRGEYSDGDIDVSEQPRPREIGRRYSSSDARPRSPEFLDSRAATPTQSTFPESLKREVRERPKYEFHSPSELLEDPSQHHEGDVPEAAVGSPLPSAVGTERSASPVTDEARPKSRSRSSSSKDVGLGIGASLVGAAAGAFAANQLTKGESEHCTSAADTPVTREIEVRESKDEDFTLQPVLSKKSKKDKKKRQKTLDLADDDADVQDTSDAQELSETAPARLPMEEPLIQPENTTRDLPLDITDATAQLNEKTSRHSLSNDASTIVLPVAEDDDLADRSVSPITSHKANLSAFEQAFEAARAARGLPEGVSKEAAMDALVARAPEIAVRKVETNDAKSEDKNPFGDDYEIGTSKNVPGSFGQDKNPFGDDFEVPPEEEGSMVSSPVSKRVEVLPVIAEVSTPMMSSRDLSRVTSEQVGGDVPAAQAEEDTWAPSSTSKKDKKKKKKDREASLVTEAVPEEPEPEAPTTIESEESKDIGETPLETPSEQVDEFAWAPTKKSKKDKKSKKSKKSRTIDDLESESQDTGSQTPAVDEEARDVQGDVSREQGPVEKAAEPPIAEEPVVEPAEDEWAVPTKKSKKDKKSKRKTLDLDSTEPTETSTPASELLDVEKDESSDPVVGSTAGFATGALAGVAGAAILSEDKDKPADEDEWAPTSSKKSKRDKKSKKKGKSFSLADDNESTPATDTPDPERDLPKPVAAEPEPDSEAISQPSKTIAEVDFPAAPEGVHVDDVTGHYFGMLKDYQPAPGAPDNKAAKSIREATQDPLSSANEVGDKELEFPSPIADSSEAVARDAPTVESLNPEHNFPDMPEVAHVSDVVGFHYGMLRDYKPDTASVQESKEIAGQILPAASEAADTSVPVEPEEDDWAVPVKKSKKDKKDKKKKRQSTFNNMEEPSTEQSNAVSESDAALPVAAGIGAAALGVGILASTGGDRMNEAAAHETPVEEEEFIPSSSKKSKKDKKKKRGSTLDDFDTAPTTSADDLATSAPVIETDATQETRDLEIPVPKLQAPVLGDDGWPIVQPVSEAAPVEDEWAVPMKKSKKDKKKKKTLLAWADGEDPTSQPTETSTPVEPAENRDVRMQESVPASEEVAIKSDAQPAVVPDSMPIVVVQPNGEDGHSMRDRRRQSRSIPGGWGEEDEEQPIVDEPMADEPAQLLDEPSMLVDEPMQDVQEPRYQEVNRDQQESAQTLVGEDPVYVVERSKKDKKEKKSKKSEPLSEEPESREVKKGQAATTPEIVEQAQVENVSGEVPKEAAPEEEWGFTSKKSKKDKKSKKSKNVADEVTAEPTREQEILAIPETSQESSSRDAGVEDEWAVPTKKSKKDKKSKRQSTRDVMDEQLEEPAPFPVNGPDHVDEIAGHYHGMLREYHPASGAPDNKPLAAPREVFNGLGVSHVDDVTSHYFGMLRDYRPVEGAPDNKSAISTRDAREIARAERLPSPVSDEETRRARRARRKASPVYRGEEPEDLPGNRSLTPPADHDDMMTTALGVAAGLGLTDAAANAASARHDAGEARNLDVGQAAASKAQAPGWSFAKINAPGDVHQYQRDSGVQFADSPTLPHDQFDSRNRDSGYVKSPASRESWPEEASRDAGMPDRPPRPQSPTSSSEDVSGKRSKRVSRDMDEASARREPSPVQSTSKDRSSKLFHSSPSNRVEQHGETPTLDTGHLSGPTTDIHRSPSIHGHDRSREELRPLSPVASGPRHVGEPHHEQPIARESHRSIFGPYPAEAGHERGVSPPKAPLHTISEHSQDTSPSLRRPREVSDVDEDRSRKTIQHQESGRNLREAAGIAGVTGIGALAADELSRDDRPASGAKSLGKSKANTKSFRSLRRATFDPEVVPSSSTHDPSEGKGKEVERDMADVYDGHGEYPGSPMSPTRPPSMRKRQSMQQIRDLETRLDQLAAENQTLAEAKIVAERHLEDIQLEQHKSGYAGQEAVETANVQLREKDEAIARLQQELEGIRQDHARLSEVNAGLSEAHETLRSEHEQRYSQLEDQHAETHQNWQESSRELETLRGQHAELSTGMEDIVRHEIDAALAEKNAEIERLRSDLELAKEKINELQQQILSGGGDGILNFRDEDYFENACQSLCQHVQQWVLKFSKFSDTLVCRTTNQIRDEKLVDRFDLAILDGSDVDAYLTDRIKRRDVFMSVVMTMIFEYIFTRYLFGMDRDQRQTLKKLEKNLAEVGPPSAVHQWRAMTLTLLAKRETFRSSRENDTEAVVLQIYDTLAKFLPPPQNLQAQVQESLRNVMRSAVDLSIEMRTQKAEYIMLPPLQPEYDTNGDLIRKVYFNASLMNERSGETSSNDELEAQQAVVRMVLFPLVVKKGNDDGEGEEEIVVCPAQVLVARPDKKSKANSGRVVSAQSDRMSLDQMSRGNASRHSLAPSTMDMSNVI